MLAVIFPLLSSIFVRKDSPIKSLADLKGKRIPAGFSAQVTLDRIIDAVLANGGVERKDIVPVLVPNVIRGADDFVEGKIDGGFFALGAAKVLEVHKSTGGIRYLPLSDDPKAVARDAEAHELRLRAPRSSPSPAFAGVDDADQADGLRLPGGGRLAREGRPGLQDRQGDVREQAQADREPGRVPRLQPGPDEPHHAGDVPSRAR